jgi:chromosome segregation ATPase
MLKIEKLSLQGFKSFCDPTDVIFDQEGITAVVGPNGCGKSNVADAINWVIGSQSAKALRGAKMEDVIFQGTRTRQPAGMAEVLLTMRVIEDFEIRGQAQPETEALQQAEASLNQVAVAVDAVSETLAPAVPASEVSSDPPDPSLSTDEEAPAADQPFKKQRPFKKAPASATQLSFAAGERIVVGRRLFRTGESEYELNGRICRLRDVQELFAGTGLGGAHYAIIEQGRIGQVLSAKPLDRRALIEEAAGISKFKMRQHQAELKLEASKTNLSRLTDIIAEIERQQNSLKRQAQRARRYKRLRQEMREVMRAVYVVDYRTSSRRLEELALTLAEIAERESQFAGLVAKGEAAQEEALRAARAAETALDEVRQETAAADLAAERARQQQTYLGEQLQALGARSQQFAKDQATIAERNQIISREILRLRDDLQRIEKEINAEGKTLTEAEDEHRRQLQGDAEAERGLEDARKRVVECVTALERWKQLQRQFTDSVDRCDNRLTGLGAEAERAQTQARDAQEQFACLNETLEVTTLRQQQTAARLADAVEQLDAARRQRDERQARLAALQRDLTAAEQRLKSLSEIDERRSYFSEAVQALMNHQHAGANGFHTLGTLADFVRVSPEHETMIETALRDELQYVVTPSFEDALRAIDFLKTEGAGRATFLVLADRHAPKPIESAAETRIEPVVVAPAPIAADSRSDAGQTPGSPAPAENVVIPDPDIVETVAPLTLDDEPLKTVAPPPAASDAETPASEALEPEASEAGDPEADTHNDFPAFPAISAFTGVPSLPDAISFNSYPPQANLRVPPLKTQASSLASASIPAESPDFSEHSTETLPTPGALELNPRLSETPAHPEADAPAFFPEEPQPRYQTQASHSEAASTAKLPQPAAPSHSPARYQTLDSVLGLKAEHAAAFRLAMPALARASVVDDAIQALQSSASTNGSGPHVALTRGGERVIAGRLLTGGSATETGIGVLGLKREIGELDGRVDELAGEIQAAETQLNDVNERIAELETARRQLDGELRQAEQQLAVQGEQLQQCQRERERTATHLRVIAQETEQMEAERRDFEGKLRHAADQTVEAEAARVEAEGVVTAAQSRLAELRRNTELRSQDLSRRRADFAAKTERRRGLQNDIRRLESEAGDLQSRLQRNQMESLEAAEQAENTRAILATLAEEMQRLVAERRRLAYDLELRAATLATTRGHAETLDRDLRAAREASGQAREVRAERDIEKAKLTSNLEHIISACHTDLGENIAEVCERLETARAESGEPGFLAAPFPAETDDDAAEGEEAEDEPDIEREVVFWHVPEDFDLDAAKARLDTLRNKIEAIGPVNMMALEELGDVEERFVFLAGQKTDIERAIADTQAAIAEIKKRSKERFVEAFHAINENFKQMFVELFGGGQGEMKLIDETDVLESGIEIIAQPPGKRLQNVLLLSGGEKAMSAMALVLAIFRYRPSPFCLLDEVDAPLDEANIGRFSGKVVEMSANTQFMIITHSKRTMEIARTLYGVTMEDPGVSKLISVKLT